MAFSAAHFVATAGGLAAKSESVDGRGGVPAAQKKELEWPPNGLERGARRGRTLCPGTAARYAAAIPAIAHTQQAISRAVAQLATHGLLPAAAMASLRSISLRLHFAAWRRIAGATSCPGARGFGSREDADTCQAASTLQIETNRAATKMSVPFVEGDCMRGTMGIFHGSTSMAGEQWLDN